MNSQRTSELSLSGLSVSGAPVKCKICSDLSVQAYILWPKLEEGTQDKCIYCDMIIKTARHFKLASFVASYHEAVQLLDPKRGGKMYNSLGNEIKIAVRVFPARQKEKQKRLEILLSLLEEKTPLIPGMLSTVAKSPVVQYYTPTGMSTICPL